MSDDGFWVYGLCSSAEGTADAYHDGPLCCHVYRRSKGSAHRRKAKHESADFVVQQYTCVSGWTRIDQKRQRSIGQLSQHQASPMHPSLCWHAPHGQDARRQVVQRRVDVAFQQIGQPPVAAAAAAGSATAVPFDEPRTGVLTVEAHQRVQQVVDHCAQQFATSVAVHDSSDTGNTTGEHPHNSI